MTEHILCENCKYAAPGDADFLRTCCNPDSKWFDKQMSHDDWCHDFEENTRLYDMFHPENFCKHCGQRMTGKFKNYCDNCGVKLVKEMRK